jgi:hypothetical protein
MYEEDRELGMQRQRLREEGRPLFMVMDDCPVDPIPDQTAESYGRMTDDMKKRPTTDIPLFYDPSNRLYRGLVAIAEPFKPNILCSYFR